MQLELTTGPERIPLHRKDGSVRAWALVDPEDFDRFGHMRWCLASNGYVVHNKNTTGSCVQTSLAREVLGLKRGDKLEADHINGDRLDNRRCNLRPATRQQQMQNRAPWGKSRYPNVVWVARRRVWKVSLKVDGKPYYFGVYEDEHEAGRAAREARRQYFPASVDERFPAIPAAS